MSFIHVQSTESGRPSENRFPVRFDDDESVLCELVRDLLSDLGLNFVRQPVSRVQVEPDVHLRLILVHVLPSRTGAQAVKTGLCQRGLYAMLIWHSNQEVLVLTLY